MSKICSDCGKEVKFLEREEFFLNGKVVYRCKECANKFSLNIAKESRGESGDEEEKNELSLSELQLHELMQMKKDLSTIKNIMLFYLILFLISLLISIISILVII